MLKKYFLFLFFLLVLPMTAQNVIFKVGGGWAKHDSNSKAVGAFKLGVGYEYEFSQRWTVTPTLQFYGKGWKDHDRTVPVCDDHGQQLVDEEGNLVFGLMGRSTSANYLQLPLLFNYYHRVGEGRYIVCSVGPYVGYGLWGKVKTKGDTERAGAEKLYYSGKTFDEPGTHRLEAGCQLMVGYQFHRSITIGLEADLGWTHFNTAGRRNQSALITLSYHLNP